MTMSRQGGSRDKSHTKNVRKNQRTATAPGNDSDQDVDMDDFLGEDGVAFLFVKIMLLEEQVAELSAQLGKGGSGLVHKIAELSEKLQRHEANTGKTWAQVAARKKSKNVVPPADKKTEINDRLGQGRAGVEAAEQRQHPSAPKVAGGGRGGRSPVSP